MARGSLTRRPASQRRTAWSELVLILKAVGISALAVVLVVMLFVMLVHWEHLWPF